MMKHPLNCFDLAADNSGEAVAEVVLPSAHSNGGFVQVRMAPAEAYAEMVAAAVLDGAAGVDIEVDMIDASEVAPRADAALVAAAEA